MNYKQDLLDIVKEHNLQILKIDCKYSNSNNRITNLEGIATMLYLNNQYGLLELIMVIQVSGN